MASPLDKSLFPLKSVSDVVNFFRKQLEDELYEPDLTALSVITGFIEISLTSGGGASVAAAANENSSLTGADDGGYLSRFPVVTFDLVDSLKKKFDVVLATVDKPKAGRQASREVIKKISDIIYYSLFRSTYKDRAHLQSMYTFLNGNKLDAFGVAFGVVAACQLLGYKDVHLAIAEDHAWVVFGKNLSETVEVTWHGKGVEDKRGQDVSAGVEMRSWLYLAGRPVICDRYTEVAAIISSINIALTPTTDCSEVAELQQSLLWLLYDLGHLQKYPNGLGNLGELEEVFPTAGRPTCEEIYREAIQSAQKNYGNHHVYPYTYLGGYYYRLLKYRETFASWANAGDVIRIYTYNSRDDEEIYKEFVEIANEMIPHIMKIESSGHSARSILRDSECFANLLRFYDGICQWEEGSLTPILHIGWAKPLVSTIAKFDYDIRSQVVINCAEDDDPVMVLSTKKTESEAKRDNHANHQQIEEGNNNCIKKDESKSPNDASNSKKSEIPTTLADLTAACGEKILNPDFLLQGGSQPFATDQKQKKVDPDDVVIDTKKTEEKEPSENAGKDMKPTFEPIHPIPSPMDPGDDYSFMPKHPLITLYSQKMKGLKDLLLAEKLNTQAISLQVTAQSQVAGKKVRGASAGVDKSNSLQSHNVSTDAVDATSSRPKRARRE